MYARAMREERGNDLPKKLRYNEVPSYSMLQGGTVLVQSEN